MHSRVVSLLLALVVVAAGPTQRNGAEAHAVDRVVVKGRVDAATATVRAAHHISTHAVAFRRLVRRRYYEVHHGLQQLLLSRGVDDHCVDCSSHRLGGPEEQLDVGVFSALFELGDAVALGARSSTARALPARRRRRARLRRRRS
ncbi:hypothetical protein HPB48_010274 [Haemaphysalis longicornis]|uniref:Secreted protein n=1 Tax=Haemaphysalis longicornis TaxID=44386 RepID=A0A9J6FUX8_HAELO|nr:hypothetical protein HPB48_010274 [Haemaphysalis longicornis]